MNKNVLIIVLGACLLISVGWIFWLEQALQKKSVHGGELESRLTSIELADRSAARLVAVEGDLARVSGQLASLREIVDDNLVTGEDPDEGEQVPTVEPELDPFSLGAIANANEQQNRYITQVEGIYHAEAISTEWASTVETDILPKLSDLGAFAQQFSPHNRSASALAYSVPDISVTNFSCRSQLCAGEVISGTMQEMLAYQNYMVEQTKTVLPSIVFSTIEPDGNKFKMRAFLAKERYEFPVPAEKQ